MRMTLGGGRRARLGFRALPPQGQRIGSILAFTGITAVCFTLIKAGLAFAPPLRYGGLRTLLGGLALLGLMAVLRRPLLPPRRSWPALLALAATSTTIGFGAMFLSPGRTGAGIASVLGNTQPLFAVVLATLFLGERVTWGKLLALLLGLAGVALIAYPALAGADAYGLSGALLALAAAGGSTLGSIIVKRSGLDDHVLAAATWQLILGSLPLLALSAEVERNARINWTPAFLGLLLFLALVGTAFTTALWYWLLQREEVGRLTMFLFLVPVAGLGIAAVIFNERIGWLAGLGTALTVAGIFVTLRESRAEPPPTSPENPPPARRYVEPDRQGAGGPVERGELPKTLS